MVKIKGNETLLAVLIFFTIVIVVGLAGIWLKVRWKERKQKKAA